MNKGKQSVYLPFIYPTPIGFGDLVVEETKEEDLYDMCEEYVTS